MITPIVRNLAFIHRRLTLVIPRNFFNQRVEQSFFIYPKQYNLLRLFEKMVKFELIPDKVKEDIPWLTANLFKLLLFAADYLKNIGNVLVFLALLEFIVNDQRYLEKFCFQNLDGVLRQQTVQVEDFLHVVVLVDFIECIPGDVEVYLLLDILELLIAQLGCALLAFHISLVCFLVKRLFHFFHIL